MQNDPSNTNLSHVRALGWRQFAIRFVAVYVLYSVVSHLVFPFPILPYLRDPLKIVVSYILGYLGMFLAIYLVVAVPIVIVGKLIANHRRESIPQLLSIALVPAVSIGLILVVAGWYGVKRAAGA